MVSLIIDSMSLHKMEFSVMGRKLEANVLLPFL